MRTSLTIAIDKLKKDFDNAIQKPIPLGEAIDAAEELGSYVDSVLEGLRDDERKQNSDEE